jgi:hypothetical protein
VVPVYKAAGTPSAEPPRVRQLRPSGQLRLDLE